jgi:hypothetical protein
MKRKIIIAVLAVCGIVGAGEVFDADFLGFASGSSNLLNTTEANREIILNDGTTIGSWDDKIFLWQGPMKLPKMSAVTR